MYNNPYNYYPYLNTAREIGNMGAMNAGNFGANAMGMGALARPRGGFLRGLSSIKWGEVLNNTQKTLNVINQAIPVYYQVKPIFSNVKSLGRLVSAFNEPDDTNNNLNRSSNQTIEKENSSNSPTFFIN
ncbi:MAG: hypothetical protein IKN63_02510 [Bacilli bacterium]|nr:hypothetical protein [Bacilli bacterium]